MTWVLALTGLAGEATVVRQWQDHAPRRVTDLVELLALAQPAIAEGVLVSALFPQMNRETAQRIARQVPCLGLADSHDDPAAERIRDWGLPLVRVDPSVDLRKAVAEARAPVEPPATALGPLIAVTGPHGSPGRTTVAAALAQVSAPSLLVDADLVAPAVAFHCGVTGGADLSAAARAAAAGRIGPDDVWAAAQPCGDIAVIAGVGEPQRVRELGLAGVAAMLEAACADGRPVVVDCGAAPCVPEELGAVREAVIARATHVVSVAVPTALGIRRWVDGAAELAQVTGGSRITVVWNRVPRSARGGQVLDRLAGVVGAAVPGSRCAGLPDDPDTAWALDRTPGPVGQVAAKGRLAAAVAGLAAGLGLGAGQGRAFRRPTGDRAPRYTGARGPVVPH